MMRLNVIFLISIITPTLCQYAIQTGLRPDVTFTEDNDRFDVTSFIKSQKRNFKDNYDPQSEEYRRKNKPRNKDLPWPALLDSEKGRQVLRKRVKDQLENHVNTLANTIIQKIRGMRRHNDMNEFAYHDNMNSEGGDVEDFNENLKAFENFKEDSVENDNARRQYHLQNIVSKLHGKNQTRRMLQDPEKEILLHYAFPVDMKIEGFLQAPSN